jgi:hypothetical protein
MYVIACRGRYKWLKLQPPFDADRDYLSIIKKDPTGVSQAEFAEWWRERIGDDEPDIPIFPEYMVQKIDEANNRGTESASSEAAAARGKSQARTGRDGASLWKYLQPRLKILVQFEAIWGKLHDLYPQASQSSYREPKLPCSIRHPDSRFTVWWDMANVAALGYVSWTVPLRAGFEISVRPFSATWFWDVAIDAFFIVDIVRALTSEPVYLTMPQPEMTVTFPCETVRHFHPVEGVQACSAWLTGLLLRVVAQALNFRTAFYVPKTGLLNSDPWEISSRYLRGWFVQMYALSRTNGKS